MSAAKKENPGRGKTGVGEENQDRTYCLYNTIKPIKKQETFAPLHPAHLADLRESGLSDEAIQAAGIYTVPPNAIDKKLGGMGNGIMSALAFPYPGVNGFERYKVWREKKADYREPKYLQQKDSDNHLYLPNTVDLEGDKPLAICEGEKKTLALHQAGFVAIGIGGVWSWRNKVKEGDSQPIPDMKLVNWKRPVVIIFDSDGHDNPQVRSAAFQLAREVTNRGGKVSIVFLPIGPEGEKVGADDFLVAHGPDALTELIKTAWQFDPTFKKHEAEIWWHLRAITPESITFDKLMALSPLAPALVKMSHIEAAILLEKVKEKYKLRSKDMKGVEDDVKAQRKARAKKGEDAVPELKNLEDVRRLHPAIDFHSNFMSVGFRVDLPDNETGLVLVISDGEGVRASVNPETVEMDGYTYQVKPGAPPFLGAVWNLGELRAFVANPTYPKDLYKSLVETYKNYLDLPEPAYGLMAAWTVGTYYAQVFNAIPFLHFFGPKESGKSKSLEAMQYTCINAWKGRDITVAALGDTADGQRGTLLLDQAEKLGTDKENGNLIGLMADSYKKPGGNRRIVDMSNKKLGRTVLEFSTYGPKAFASTKPLDPDLADRCIKIPMTRTRRLIPDLEGWEPIWGELRDGLYKFTLASFKAVHDNYMRNPGNGTRIMELWRPMLTMLISLGVEKEAIEPIRAFFMESAQEGRYEPTGWECTLLETVRDAAADREEKFEMAVTEIVKAMGIEGEKQPSGKWIGDILSRYHISPNRRRGKVDGAKQTIYAFEPARVKELCEIYFREYPPNDLSLLSPGEKGNGSQALEGTRENEGTRPLLSTVEDEGDNGHEGTRPQESTCPPYVAVNVEDKGRGHEGHEKTGVSPNKNLSLLPGDEVDPLGGEI